MHAVLSPLSALRSTYERTNGYQIGRTTKADDDDDKAFQDQLNINLTSAIILRTSLLQLQTHPDRPTFAQDKPATMAPPPPPPPSAVEVVNVDSSDKTTTTLRPKNAQHENEHEQQHHPDVVNVDGSSTDDKKKPEEQVHTDNGAAPAVQPPPTHQAPDEHVSSGSTAGPFSQEPSPEKPTYQQLNEQQGKDIPRPLVFEDKLVERAYLKQRLAAAFRIFGRHGFDEGVAGHITVRVSTWLLIKWLGSGFGWYGIDVAMDPEETIFGRTRLTRIRTPSNQEPSG